MKKYIILSLIFVLMLMQACAPTKPIVFIPEIIQTQPMAYREIMLYTLAILEENALLRKQYYLLWMAEQMRGINQEPVMEMDDLPE